MVGGVGGGQETGLAGLGEIHHDREEGLGVVAVVGACQLRHVGQDLPLAGAVIDGKAVLPLVVRHVGGNVHAAAEFLHQLAVQRVDLGAAFFDISCHSRAPFWGNGLRRLKGTFWKKSP